MAVARVTCRAQIGLLAPVVQVEVHLGAGLPCFNIVGLPATEVKESKERVRAALVNSGFELPAGRITINLAPADLPKDGGRFDLAIAIGILAAAGQVGASSSLEQVEFLGELGLTGALRAIRGALPSAAAAAQAGHSVILPRDNAADLQCMPGLAAHAAGSLLEVCAHLDQRQALPKERGAKRCPTKADFGAEQIEGPIVFALWPNTPRGTCPIRLAARQTREKNAQNALF